MWEAVEIKEAAAGFESRRPTCQRRWSERNSVVMGTGKALRESGTERLLDPGRKMG